MLTRKDILKILHNEMPVLKKRFAVREIGLFGSYVKNEEQESSDIDILVTFEKSHDDLFNFLGLKYYLEDILSKKVDLVMREAIKPRIKERILREAVYV
jgi:predicted nucleotidyltransferase